MTVIFAEEDAAASVCGAVQACAANVLPGNPANHSDHNAAVGGTLGSTEDTAQGKMNSGTSLSVYMFEMAPVATNWAAGTAVVRIDVSTANANMDISAVYLCQRDSACGSKATYGSATGLTVACSAGVKTINVTVSSITALTTDLLYIVVELTTTSGMNQTCGLTASQNIDTPIVTALNLTQPSPAAVGVTDLNGVANLGLDLTQPTAQAVGVTDLDGTLLRALRQPTPAGVSVTDLDGVLDISGDLALTQPAPAVVGVTDLDGVANVSLQLTQPAVGLVLITDVSGTLLRALNQPTPAAVAITSLSGTLLRALRQPTPATIAVTDIDGVLEIGAPAGVSIPVAMASYRRQHERGR